MGKRGNATSAKNRTQRFRSCKNESDSLAAMAALTLSRHIGDTKQSAISDRLKNPIHPATETATPPPRRQRWRDSRCSGRNFRTTPRESPDGSGASMVSTASPSAWTASIRQPRTTLPATTAWRAPQEPCSQPTWLPVRPWSCRSQSISDRRTVTRSHTSTRERREVTSPPSDRRRRRQRAGTGCAGRPHAVRPGWRGRRHSGRRRPATVACRPAASAGR